MTTQHAAENASGFTRSCWLMLDFDKPAHMPAVWRDPDMDDLLKVLDPVLPVARAAFGEVRSSGGRCEGPGRGEASHPEKIDLLRTWLRVKSEALGLTFTDPADTRQTPCLLVDMITLNRSQPFSCNAPEITPAARAGGYVDAGAQVSVIEQAMDGSPLAARLVAS